MPFNLVKEPRVLQHHKNYDTLLSMIRLQIEKEDSIKMLIAGRAGYATKIMKDAMKTFGQKYSDESYVTLFNDVQDIIQDIYGPDL